MSQLSGRYLEDFSVGQRFGSGRLRIDKERIFTFAAEFDPQPFHLDEAADRRICGRISPRVTRGWSLRACACGQRQPLPTRAMPSPASSRSCAAVGMRKCLRY